MTLDLGLALIGYIGFPATAIYTVYIAGKKVKNIKPNAKKIKNKTRASLGLFCRYTSKHEEKVTLAYSLSIMTKRTVVIGKVSGLEVYKIER